MEWALKGVDPAIEATDGSTLPLLAAPPRQWQAAVDAAPAAAAVLQHEMGWDDAQTRREVQQYVNTLTAWTHKIGLAKDTAKA